MNPKNTYTKNLTPSLTNLRTAPTKPKFTPPTSPASTFKSNLNSSLNIKQPTASPGMQAFGNKMQVSPTGTRVQPKPAVQGPVQNPTSVSPGATPSTTPVLSPAGQDYASKLQGIKDAALNIQSTLNAPPKTQIEEPKKQESEYLKYLRSMFNPEEAKLKATAYQNASQRLADKQSEQEKVNLEARRKYEELLDASGGLKSGAQESATMDRRRSNQELADLALSESALARSAGVALDAYNQALTAGKSIYEAEEVLRKEEQSPLTLEEAKSLGLPFGTTLAEARLRGLVPGGGGSGGYTPGNATVDSYIANIQNGSMKMSDVPEEYLSAVSQGLSTQPKQRSQINQQATSVIDELLANPKLDRIFGPADQFVGGVFGEAAVARNKFNQLKGLLSLENIKYLKGTGAISDAEQRLLANASTALGRNLGNTEARRVLSDLKRELETLYVPGGGGNSAGEDVILPDGTVINTSW